MFQRVPSRRRELPVKHPRTPANTIWLVETMVWTNVAQVSLPLHSFISINTTSQEVNTRPMLKVQACTDTPKPIQNLALSLSYMY